MPFDHLDTAERNLEKLLSSEEGGGMHLLQQVSVTSPHADEVFLPFHYDPFSGDITTFTPRSPPPDLNRGYFVVLRNYRCNPVSGSLLKNRLVSVDDGPRKPTPEASTALNSTLILYNDSLQQSFGHPSL